MKLLRKMGLVVFSLMLFCGLSITAFAFDFDVTTHADIGDDNTRIILDAKSNDGVKHNFGFCIEYYDRKGRLVDEFNNTHETDKSLGAGIDWTVYDWERARVYIYCDGTVIEAKTIRRTTYNKNNIYATCYVSDSSDCITANFRFKNNKYNKCKIELECKNSDREVIYTQVARDEINGEGELGCDWSCVPKDWKYATVKFYANGELLSTQGLTK